MVHDAGQSLNLSRSVEAQSNGGIVNKGREARSQDLERMFNHLLLVLSQVPHDALYSYLEMAKIKRRKKIRNRTSYYNV